MRIVFLFFSFVGLGISSLPGQEFTEILGRPTDNSITVSVLFDWKVDLYIEYGTLQGNYSYFTNTASNIKGKPDEIELQDLLPDTRYYYRTRYRVAGSGSFLSGSEHSFHTQRPAGSTFTFTVESDEHMYDKKGVRSLYQVCLANQAADHPDFMLSLGDTYGDDHHAGQMTSAMSDSLHRAYRTYFGSICHSVPFYFCLGNHEGEFDYYLTKTPPDNIAVYGTLWRKFYYPGPYPNNFYSGNTDLEPFGMGNPENYYAWTWGDALFVVLDVYRYQCDTSAKPRNWNWTIGFPQYTWLKSTLENSSAKYKFVFAHHTRGQGRGGISTAPYYEWGGYEADGATYTFPANRPGWGKPIHKLFVDNGVTIFFQGHDHLFAHEVLDGVIYQEVPMPSDSTYEIGMLANADAYVSDRFDGSGHIRVMVSPSCARVDFVRAYLPADTASGIHHNRETAFSYSIGDCPSQGIEDQAGEREVKVFPNPASDRITVGLPGYIKNSQISLVNKLGQILLQTPYRIIDVSNIQDGIYFLLIRTSTFKENRKVIISR